jgi:hypothetical protein
MDEQCIADIAACVVSGQIIERSKDDLDDAYNPESELSKSILTGLEVYGAQKFGEEFKYCVDEILRVCPSGSGGGIRLRGLLFKKATTNAFPSVFAIVLLAFHELIVKENKAISDYSGVRDALRDLNSRIATGVKGTASEERRKNIDVVKGLIGACFIDAEGSRIYGNHATTDIEGIIRRSEIELADHELKQGYLTLSEKRIIDTTVTTKVLKTICAIARR